MDELHTYTPEDVILSNLEETFLRAMQVSEQELAHLHELAVEIASEMMDGTFLPASLQEHRLPLPVQHAQIFSESTQSLSLLFRDHTTRQRVLLCTEVSQLLPTLRSLWQEFFFSGNDEPDTVSFNRISYQKNSYADTAYQQFSELLQKPRASYSHGFPSACADVFNGLSEYCILPIENSSEGRLSSFSRLISEYDLKIAATCVVNVDSERSTRFALLRRTLAHLPVPSDLPQYYECACELSDYPQSEDILAAARFCELSLIRAEISPVDGQNFKTQLHPVFRTDKGNLDAFLLYLSMEVPNVNHIGLYSDLSDRKS